MIQFITHSTEKYSHLDSVRLALSGGCRWIQLRMKGASIDEIRPIALEVQQLCREAGATFIIDDHVSLVAELQADGVHLGKQDMPIAEARRILGPNRIIGATANTFADIIAHHQAGANYIGCGPFRFTATKEHLAPLLGLEGYRRIVKQMREAGIELPLVAIGGITEADIPDLLQTEVSGIALSGYVLQSDHPAHTMARLMTLTNPNPKKDPGT